jgi:hypothetical protein
MQDPRPQPTTMPVSALGAACADVVAQGDCQLLAQSERLKLA